MILKKNTAGQKWIVYAFDVTTGLPVTGDAANITANISLDWAANAATNDTNPTERSGGYYEFDLLQAETNADVLALYPVSATSDVIVQAVPVSLRTYVDPLTAVQVRTEIDSNSTQLNTILTNIATVDTVVDGIQTDLSNGTDGLGALLAAIQALNDVDIAAINAEVVDVMFTDTHAELAAVPAANAPLADKINWLFMLSRNKITATATEQIVRNDADSADVGTAVLSDDTTTATRGEFS